MIREVSPLAAEAEGGQAIKSQNRGHPKITDIMGRIIAKSFGRQIFQGKIQLILFSNGFYELFCKDSEIF